MTEKELMKLVADYGKECISAGIAEMSLSDALKQRMADDVRTAHVALTDRLRALLTELEAAREDAARWKHVLRVIGAQTQLGRANFVVVGLDAPMNVMRGSVAEHFTKAIDAARKGEA